MNDFLENAKLYLKIKEEMGIIDADDIQVSSNKIKELSQFFSVKTKLAYEGSLDLTYRYFYNLCIDGVTFIAVSNLVEARKNGLVESQFKEEAEVWG